MRNKTLFPLFLLFVVLLSACTTPTMVIPTLTVTSTFTIVPTTTSTTTSTPTPTPIPATPIPATPEGAAGYSYDPETKSLINPQSTPIYNILAVEEDLEVFLPLPPMSGQAEWQYWKNEEGVVEIGRTREFGEYFYDSENGQWVEKGLVDPEIEQKVREHMPKLWYYNQDNELITRNPDELEMRWKDEREQEVVLFNRAGEKVAWGDMTLVEPENMEWYSVTDRTGEDSVVPVVLASWMGEAEKRAISMEGGERRSGKGVVRFTDENMWFGVEKVLDMEGDSGRVERFRKIYQDYGFDFDGMEGWGIETGESIMEAYICKLASYLLKMNEGKYMSPEKVRFLIKRGNDVYVEYGYGESKGVWHVNRGIEIELFESLDLKEREVVIEDNGILKIRISFIEESGMYSSIYTDNIVVTTLVNIFDNVDEREENLPAKDLWSFGSVLNYYDFSDNGVLIRTPFVVEERE